MKDLTYHTNPYRNRKRAVKPPIQPVKRGEEEVTGRELLPSSSFMAEQDILSEAMESIAKGQIRHEEELLNKKIHEHYVNRASKLMHKIWKECNKRTKHSDRTMQYESNYQCNTCSAPLRSDDRRFVLNSAKAKEGIEHVARKLRQADQEAGIEWIP